jgi:hypothetical protein
MRELEMMPTKEWLSQLPPTSLARLAVFIVLWAASFLFFLGFNPNTDWAYNLGLIMVLAFLVCALPYTVLYLVVRDRQAADFVSALAFEAVSRRNLLWVGVLSFVAIGMAWLVATGYSLDYGMYYLRQWHTILAGHNPWQPGKGFVPNFFGPTHLLFFPFVAIHDMIPKLLFGACFFGSVYIIIKPLIESKPIDSVPLIAALVVLALSPYLWAVSLHYAHNDIVVALLCVLGLVSHSNHRLGRAGFFVGVAILYKFYPAFILPFLAIDKEGIRLKPLVVATATVLTVFVAAYVLWQSSVFDPLVSPAIGLPKWLSIFRAMQAYPLLTLGIQNIERFSIALMLLASGIVLLICYVWSVPANIGATLGLLAALLFHTRGHQQYYTTYILLICYCLTMWSDQRSRSMFWASLPFVFFLTWFETWYTFTRRFNLKYLEALRDHIGLVAFPLGLATLILTLWLVRGARREKIIALKW